MPDLPSLNPTGRSRLPLPLRLVGLLAVVLSAACSTTTPLPPVATTPAASPPAPLVRPEPRPLAPVATAPVRVVVAPVPEPSVTLEKAADEPDAPQSQAAPRVYTDLWERIRDGFAMGELDTPLVAEKERFYLARAEGLQRMFARGERYLFFIVEELERRGLPTELALLPFVESAMNPVALSPARAAGLWQFIPSTGKAYDLQQNWWVDNRRDVIKSTRAALDYLQKIYEMQGNDWFLALASYNWGEGAVQRAVRKDQARGGPGDYLSLDMPAETRHYVPKLIALRNIVRRAAELGVALPTLPNRPYFATIEKTRPIDLKLAAQFAGMSVDEFVALNPSHNRPVIAASATHAIVIPADRVAHFMQAMEKHERSRQPFASWQPYTLKSGESLDTVARRSGLSVAELRRANSLREGTRPVGGTRILTQHEDVEDETQVETFAAPRVYEQVERPAVYHTVAQKESASSIASRYGITAASLAAWNGLKEGVKRGMRLLVQPPATQTLVTTEEGERKVVSVTPRVVTPPAPVAVAEAPRPAPAAAARPAGKASPAPASASATAHKAASPSAATSARKKPVRS